MAQELSFGASPGCIVEISETCYINSELFVKWLEHFTATGQSSKRRYVRKLPLQIAERNGLAHTFNVEHGMAGKKWYYSFMKRHPKLYHRQHEATSMARASGFNTERLYKLLTSLRPSLCNKHKFEATRIFIVDDSGFSQSRRKLR